MEAISWTSWVQVTVDIVATETVSCVMSDVLAK